MSRAVDGALAVEGEVDMATAPLLEAGLRELGTDADAVVDLSAVSFMDSSGLNVFARCYKSLDQAGRRLILRRPQPAVRRVLELGGIGTFAVLED